MRLSICLLAFLIAFSGSREIVNIVFFLYHQNTIQTTICINKKLVSKKCKGKCYLAKQLKQDQSSKDKTIPPIDSKHSFEFYMPEQCWTAVHLTGSVEKQNFNYLEPESGNFVENRFIPPDVCG
ncbi:MAG: hypothetical protein IPM92_07920 [Saprospiraceae bacterium]|nr:hypothetical protein [Saprospiraceae bacterium]